MSICNFISIAYPVLDLLTFMHTRVHRLWAKHPERPPHLIPRATAPCGTCPTNDGVHPRGDCDTLRTHVGRLPTSARLVRAIHGSLPRALAPFVRLPLLLSQSSTAHFNPMRCRDQEVTLTTVTPPRKVRIVGITPDYGLLRTLPELGRDGSMEYIDLQPDGNSFDLLAGLIKTKV